MRFILLMGVCLLLGACEQPATTAVESSADATVATAAAEPIAPDTSSWPAVIDAGMEYPYRQQPSLCIGSGREDRKRLGFLEPDKTAKHLFRTFYIKPEAMDASAHIDHQLRILVRRGLLRTRPITVEGEPLIGYLPTTLGWALNPSQRVQSLCFMTGVSHVSHITDYTALPDEHSGLETYHVEYELGPFYLAWFDAEVRSAFPDYKQKMPTLLKALLIKGPKAYYFATAAVPKRSPRLKPPTLEQAMTILLEGNIIDSICEHGDCDAADPGKLKALHVAAGSRGSGTSIRFSYDMGTKGTLLARISLARNAEGKWDTGRGSYSGKVLPLSE